MGHIELTHVMLRTLILVTFAKSGADYGLRAVCSVSRSCCKIESAQ